jgi:hypothetical protein
MQTLAIMARDTVFCVSMLSVANKAIVLSGVMLSVVAPPLAVFRYLKLNLFRPISFSLLR